MQRRTFLKLAGSSMVASSRMVAQTSAGEIDLTNCSLMLSQAAGKREKKAAQVLVEEAAKRCGISWPVTEVSTAHAQVTIYLATAGSAHGLSQRPPVPEMPLRNLPPDAFALHSGRSNGGDWIMVTGADERGLLFGVGKLLRMIHFDRQQAVLRGAPLQIVSSPKLKLRGHQLGYRPKTNAYDAWTVEMWDQYIRDLALFGTNAIELMPPRTDDLPDSPHFPLPPAQMMIQMSRIADEYGLDVWVWYPAMEKEYSDARTVNTAIQEWEKALNPLPRLDALFVPGGDPGHTQPKYLLALLEKQKQNLRKAHPQLQMWVSPQGFSAAWMTELLGILEQPHTHEWLDGLVYGPQSRLSAEEFRRAIPKNYPIRSYPDITHSLNCQYPVPNWDIAYALTEGREVINPRPRSEALILRQSLPLTIGFITYSEGCNDDVNKFVWSGLGWDPEQPVAALLRDFAHYFIGSREATGFAQGLLNLEQNWVGSLATNEQAEVTLAEFDRMEERASPQVIANWRWQQALYRACFDAYVRRRLLQETGHLTRARDLLSRVWEIGWSAVPPGIGEPPGDAPANRLEVSPLIDAAITILSQPLVEPASAALRDRVRELAYALFATIRMQLAVEKYQGEAVERAANLDTLETPVTDIAWLRAQLATIKEMAGAEKQVAAIRSLLSRTDPGPGGFYDELGNVANRPHLLTSAGVEDPEFRHTPQIGFSYPDKWGAAAPISWKHWAEPLFDAALEMRYEGLDPECEYKVRVVYSGSSDRIKIRLEANHGIEIHSYIVRSWPPAPQEFAIPKEATAGGSLHLSWTHEPGLGGNGIGCQVSEVWLVVA